MTQSEFCEIKVSVKDEEQKLARKFPHYGAIKVSREDPELRKMVDQTIQDFQGDKQDCDVAVNFKYKW